MEQRDLIKDEIERLGRVLGKILADFIGAKAKGAVSQGIEISEEQLKGELDLEIDELLSFNKDELRKYLEAKKMNADHLELLSNYVEEIGLTKIETDKEVAQLYFDRSIELLDVADEISSTASYIRMRRISKIQLLRSKLDI